ncbi:hypothetical protein GE061_014116 [Apolygus lucorum]|uniref:Uncharacterized protein n=1 Tax=Apolygus lucorum TaxID=248454 RepID=A0A8S9XPX8_APOLU|nr:hypothetical protein GE061_014116 [Apolygus lucorum]
MDKNKQKKLRSEGYDSIDLIRCLTQEEVVINVVQFYKAVFKTLLQGLEKQISEIKNLVDKHPAVGEIRSADISSSSDNNRLPPSLLSAWSDSTSLLHQWLQVGTPIEEYLDYFPLLRDGKAGPIRHYSTAVALAARQLRRLVIPPASRQRFISSLTCTTKLLVTNGSTIYCCYFHTSPNLVKQRVVRTRLEQAARYFVHRVADEAELTEFEEGRIEHLKQSFRKQRNNYSEEQIDERKIFGNSLFKKVIEELNFLSEVGIEVPASPTQTVRVKFALGCLLGDNLGLNQICGFVESFSAKHCCRICSCNYQEAPHREDPATLRDSSNYLVAVAQNDVQATGVKEKAVWLGVRGFDLFINTSPDHMHDFLEGVCPYLMALVLNGLETHLHRFTVSLLNARVRSFDFGPESNIPPALTLSRDKISKMSASEMRVLVLYFGLLIGDMVIPFTDEQLLTFKKGEYRWKVPLVKGRRYEAHAYYRLYLWLRQLHDMLLCDAIDEAFAASLSTHIEALLKCYLELSAPFNRTHLPPKLHFLTHYPTAMLRNGPILSLSSMRFESKHRALKKSLNSVATTVNIPLSASKKIQLQLNSMLLSSKLPSSSFIPGYLRPVDRESLEGIINKFQLDRMVVVKSTKTLTSPLSVEYKIGQILAPEIVDHMPLFFQIQRILYSPILDRAFAEGPLMVSVKFNEHYHAVEVRRTAVFRAYDLNSLLFPLPNTLTAARDGNLGWSRRILMGGIMVY